MRNRAKLASLALAVSLIVVVTASEALANTLSFSNRNFRTTFTPMSFSSAANGGGIRIECNVTMEGSFHLNSIAKVAGNLIGHITRAIAEQEMCTGGLIWALNGTELQGGVAVPQTLPWHVRYRGFTGALPAITTVRIEIVGASFLGSIIGVACLYRSTEANPVRAILTRNAGGTIASVSLDEAASIPKAVGGGLCPANIFARGTGTFWLLNTTNSISLSLI